MKILNQVFPIILTLIFLMPIRSISNTTDTITTTHILRDGETIVSSDETFELGFFSPGNSTNRYVGMWYKKVAVMTVVWVANREVPLTNTTGVLKVVEPGRLLLLNGISGVTVWSSNTSRPVKNPVAKLLDSGNFVVKDANDDEPENFAWESFDHPTDTILAGMKFGWNFRTNNEAYMTSWKSKDDPSLGDYSYHFDPTGYPQSLLKKGSTVLYKTGPWNGLRFSGIRAPNLTNPIFNSGIVLNKNEAYFSYEQLSKSIILKITLSVGGVGQFLACINPLQGWVAYIDLPTDHCDIYGLCGAYGICSVEKSPVCGCLDRFTPKDPDGWVHNDWSNGCVRRTPLNCQKGDVFIKYSGIKLPDTHTNKQSSWYNESMTLDECKVVCLRNCSCTAYSTLDMRGSGCLLWFEELINIKELAGGEDIYIRMASSKLHSGRKKRIILEVSLSLLLGVVLFGLTLRLYFWRRKNQRLRRGMPDKDFTDNTNDENSDVNMELPIFNLNTITKATNNFSIKNKLGQGGFGPVYKGVLEGGQEIAVKRLSRNSLQGIDEFKNEVKCIAKIQHRNLVKLLGCCIQREEYMLIYEYMPNKSLDVMLFDPVRSMALDWRKRFDIINGIARGLMYLHQDSRLRIIHRDLKASNILLDSDMNPKISDFGMARSFRGNETGANTNRVVGTYGYMSPEYAIDGIFSIKSDVFSFGVLVLEIVSGKRNRGFSHQEHDHNLLGHTWMLYKEGRSLEIVDPSLNVSNYLSQVLRSIHVGLLCVQKCQEDRPSMSAVVAMFGNESELPQAKQPGFFTERDLVMAESSNSSSVNQMSITIMEAR